MAKIIYFLVVVLTFLKLSSATCGYDSCHPTMEGEKSDLFFVLPIDSLTSFLWNIARNSIYQAHSAGNENNTVCFLCSKKDVYTCTVKYLLHFSS